SRYMITSSFQSTKKTTPRSGVWSTLLFITFAVLRQKPAASIVFRFSDIPQVDDNRFFRLGIFRIADLCGIVLAVKIHRFRHLVLAIDLAFHVVAGSRKDPLVISIYKLPTPAVCTLP